MRAIWAFIRDEGGAMAIEYVLIAGIMAAALVAGVAGFAGAFDGVFEKITPNL